MLFKNMRVGDIIHLDPFVIPQLKIITKEEADKIANQFPKHNFIITEFKSFADYVKRHKS